MDLLTRVVAAFEAFSAKVYLDAGGKPTVGWGHLVRSGEDFSDGLTREQANVLLAEDLRFARSSVDTLFRGVPLRDYQADALTSFVYNVGGGAPVRDSRLRQHILKGNDREAGLEFLRWVYATTPSGVHEKLAGLVRRRDCESVWFLGAHPDTVCRIAGIPIE